MRISLIFLHNMFLCSISALYILDTTLSRVGFLKREVIGK
jgi:hypothetical protein